MGDWINETSSGMEKRWLHFSLSLVILCEHSPNRENLYMIYKKYIRDTRFIQNVTLLSFYLSIRFLWFCFEKGTGKGGQAANITFKPLETVQRLKKRIDKWMKIWGKMLWFLLPPFLPLAWMNAQSTCIYFWETATEAVCLLSYYHYYSQDSFILRDYFSFRNRPA